MLPLQNRLNPSGLQSYRELYTSRNCLSISPGDKLRNRVKDSYTVSTGRGTEGRRDARRKLMRRAAFIQPET